MSARTDLPAVADGLADRLVAAAVAAIPQVSAFFVDPQLRYRAVLGGAFTRHGYDAPSVLGRTVAQVLPDRVADRYVALFTRALSGESFVETVQSADGSATFECSFAPAVDDGVIVGAVATVRDVTAERQAVAELTATDELHRMLMATVGDGIALTSVTEARYLWVSPSMQRVTGWRPEDLLGRDVYEFIHPDDADRVGTERARVLAGPDEADQKGEQGVTYRFRRPDGGWTWTEARIRRVAGKGDESLLATVRDVSARVALEQELAQATEMFELSFSAAPIGMALVDVDGGFLKVNDALCALLDRDPATLLDGTFQQLTHPDDLDADLDLLRETVAGERAGYRMEKRYLRPDGSVVWAFLAVSAVRRDGTPRFFISQVEDITDRKHAVDELERLATTDALTGLPNRLLLMDRLRHALVVAQREGHLVGVLFVDLDRFKHVNDTFGHDAGDELLCRTAARLAEVARPGDSVTRLGGDEFVMVCEQVRSVSDVTRIAERLDARLRSPFTIFGHEISVTASTGVTAGNAVPAEVLLRQADQAMYAAKQSRSDENVGGRVDVWSEAYEVLAQRQLTLHAELREGIPRGELVVHYQPIVDLPSGVVTAREALVRWQHPTLGLLPPAAFLEGTDRSRLGGLLGEEVLRRACSAAAGWPAEMSLHVNISARHLAQPGLPVFVGDCLRDTGLSADRLVLEITEGLVLAASSSTLHSTHALTAMGVGLSLDDFGTGNSSLAALHRLPIDSFKIDRSFVAGLPADPAGASLVEGLIGLGSHLDIGVIAEGVETPEQAEWLASRGCPQAQGFLFGRPAELG